MIIVPVEVKSSPRLSVGLGALSCSGLVRPYWDGARLLSGWGTLSLSELCLPPFGDEADKWEAQKVPIAFVSARPDFWQIFGKWLFERKANNREKRE